MRKKFILILFAGLLTASLTVNVLQYNNELLLKATIAQMASTSAKIIQNQDEQISELEFLNELQKSVIDMLLEDITQTE